MAATVRITVQLALSPLISVERYNVNINDVGENIFTTLFGEAFFFLRFPCIGPISLESDDVPDLFGNMIAS